MELKQQDIDNAFLTGPGEDLVAKTLLQMSKVPGFITLFGPYRGEKDEQQHWADYDRWDWSMRMLPAICIYEANTEDRDSDQAFLRGTVRFKVYWPANFRRSDQRRIEAAFKGVINNFFSSDLVKTMLDEIYFNSRPEKVYGLNEYGKTLTWTPNTEAMIDSAEPVPVTIFDVQYRIDLRAWYRAMEYEGRTKGNPFEKTLYDLTKISNNYQGMDDNEVIHVEIPDLISVQNP